MRRFLGKLASWAVALAAIMFLSDVSGTDPVWYMLGLWLWKDLSETIRKEDAG